MITSIEEKLDFSQVLLQPRVAPKGQEVDSRSQVSLDVDGRVPIIVANMDSIGTFPIASIMAQHNIMVAILKDFTAAEWDEALSDAELGLKESLLVPTFGLKNLPAELDRLEQILSSHPGINMICLDVANGYMHAAAWAVSEARKRFPSIDICAGNVVEADGLLHLADAGASVVKVGIGSGGVCLTRKMTGVGYPQFSAMMDLFPVAQEAGVKLVSDGGIRVAGDFVKAFAAGADFVMAGSIFAGHEETGTHFHGMSSHKSRGARLQAKESYRASEGREVVLAPRGSLGHTLSELLGGIRSGCSYLGVRELGLLKNAPIRVLKVAEQLNRIQGVASEG